MAKVSYGSSVKPAVKNNARARRHMRRMLEAIERRKIEEILSDQLRWELPAGSIESNQAEHSYKRTVSGRVSKAVETDTVYHKQILAGAARYAGGELENGICMPTVAIFNAGHRCVSKDATHITRVRRTLTVK